MRITAVSTGTSTTTTPVIPYRERDRSQNIADVVPAGQALDIALEQLPRGRPLIRIAERDGDHVGRASGEQPSNGFLNVIFGADEGYLDWLGDSLPIQHRPIRRDAFVHRDTGPVAATGVVDVIGDADRQADDHPRFWPTRSLGGSSDARGDMGRDRPWAGHPGDSSGGVLARELQHPRAECCQEDRGSRRQCRAEPHGDRERLVR